MHSPELRNGLYGLLSDFFHYPALRESPIFDQELLQEVAARVGTDDPPQVAVDDIHELQTAYTGLFVNRLGGVRAHPYGAVYLETEPRLMGKSSQGVVAAYREAGIRPEDSAEPPDALVLELAFMAHLTEAEVQAAAAGDQAALEQTREQQIKFCRDYLHPWIFEFCRRVTEDETAHPLYRWGARLLEKFSRQEQAGMSAGPAG
ncbi:MAG TPA: molecular chaperone TorD family protein [Desulfuromonadales bacterium]|nr:molecular chaperone TorD family protein [Desulfuromonadales bacterium]